MNSGTFLPPERADGALGFRCRIAALAAVALGIVSLGSASTLAASAPVVTAIFTQGGELVIAAEVPSGYRHAVLESSDTVVAAQREALAAGAMDGGAGTVTFKVPDPRATKFLRLRLGTDPVVPPATHSGAPFFVIDYDPSGDLPLTSEEKVGHVLSRLAYGPSPEDLQTVMTLGVAAFLDQQLDPESIDESANTELRTREAALFFTQQPMEETKYVSTGDIWRYFKGLQAPPANWADPGFDDSSWLTGPTGIGYGDNDDATELTDMRQTATNPGYLSVYLRKDFTVSAPAEVDRLVLRVDFDDGFVAYLNGVEVARTNVAGTPPVYNVVAAGDHEAGSPVDFDLSAQRSLLRAGANTLAIAVFNTAPDSSDLSLIPELLSQHDLPLPPRTRIRGIDALQQLLHVRGIYSKRQLQTVLAEFWDNHFTTDYDKVATFFEDLRNSNAQTAMTVDEAAAQAAQVEYEEYQFFYDHALGNFGDLLLYSATSPSQLIYLDNVLNRKGAPNENYAREILELFGFGVDNRYNQTDIEQLAKCFTGWTIRKVWPNEKQAFPASARTPPTTASVQFQDEVVLGLGSGWKYFKGTQEPAPGANNAATIAWAQPGFNAAAWLEGATGIGYGDNDDATVLADMRDKYVSVYLRREFALANPDEIENLLLSVDYDDGFVAYLNGTEVARSRTMQDTGTPPAFNRTANGGHEAGDASDSFSLRSFQHLLRPAPELNVLAIQVHNLSADSSDLSILPKLVNRRLLPGSIENGDPNGVWTFRFNPGQHDTNSKVLFSGTANEFKVPAGRTGLDGLKDAVEVVDSFVNHPSVSEFICLKLINKLVSDEISLRSYHDGTAPEPLMKLMRDAIAAWHSTQPAGNIKTVLRTILSPTTQDSYFWSRTAYRGKVKTPIEFINSSVRALRANVGGTSLPTANDDMGMHFFTRDDPDGWSELGVKWIDTGTLLSRIQFAEALTGDRVASVRWDAVAWTKANNAATPEAIIDYFNQLLFHGKLTTANRELLIRFATTDDAGNPLPFAPARADYATRVRELVGMILSMPQWHYQ